jgi:hypothetical protein
LYRNKSSPQRHRDAEKEKAKDKESAEGAEEIGSVLCASAPLRWRGFTGETLVLSYPAVPGCWYCFGSRFVERTSGPQRDVHVPPPEPIMRQQADDDVRADVGV